jgi:hypothetical protein
LARVTPNHIYFFESTVPRHSSCSITPHALWSTGPAGINEGHPPTQPIPCPFSGRPDPTAAAQLLPLASPHHFTRRALLGTVHAALVSNSSPLSSPVHSTAPATTPAAGVVAITRVGRIKSSDALCLPCSSAPLFTSI